MSNEISISIKASNPKDLAAMVKSLAEQFDAGRVVEASVNEGETEASVVVQTGSVEKRGRGRPRKEQEAPAAAAPEPFLAGGLAGHDGTGMELAGATGAYHGSGSAADAGASHAGSAGTAGPVTAGGGAGNAGSAGAGSAGVSGTALSPNDAAVGTDGAASGATVASGAERSDGAAVGQAGQVDAAGSAGATSSGTGATSANGNAGAATPANGNVPAGQVQVVADLTPEKAREAAISQLQTYFGKNPNNMTEITRLQTKYGVKMFKEVTDARALEFLADVKLVAAGSPVAA